MASQYGKTGFSLVELSIVLVILGLLTGGILGGQSLIHAAELRSITKEYETFQTAINTFKDKYFAVPGDMRNATDFWGYADTSGSGGECGDPAADTGTGTETCNGTGNGRVADFFQGEDYEWYRFWQHLSNAGLITGNYTGVGTGSPSVLGTNVPASKFGGVGWIMAHIGNYPGDGDAYQADYGSEFIVGAPDGWNVSGPAFSPEEAWNIDTKVDDGIPGTGKVIIYHWAECSTATAADEVTEPYDLSVTGAVCTIQFTHAL